MSINIFGSRSITKPSADKSVDRSVNSKFITLTKNVQTKLDKSGDKMTGTLEMGENTITSSSVPNSDAVLTNKKYVDSKFLILEENMKNKLVSESVLTKLYVDSKLAALEQSLEDKYLSFRKKFRKRVKSE